MFQPNLCIFLYPFVKKEIVALFLNRNTEAGRLLGGSMGILEHFSAALHHEFFVQSVMKKPGICWSAETEKAGFSVVWLLFFLLLLSGKV